MSAAHPVSEQPKVSVIVPARNEEASLGACLRSLVEQRGVEFEIIVVDDQSTDRTREIAESFAGVRILEAGPLPAGWTGKNNAVAAGARQARGQWLLFTDADTVHLPGSLARSVREAEGRGVALFTYSPEQEVHGLCEKAVMPVIFAELASRFRPRDVCNPASAVAAANGQYLLISRDAYDLVGGHAAIARSLLEDVALARAVKGSGRKIFLRYGGDAVRTRMYRSFAQLKEGWTKNLALLFPSAWRLAILRMTEFVLIVAAVIITITEGLEKRAQPAIVVGILAVIVSSLFLNRIRKAQFSWDANCLALIGLPLFSYLLVRSSYAYEKGTVSWRGRNYGGRPSFRTNAEPEIRNESGPHAASLR